MSAASGPQEATWEEQLRQPLYLLYNLSAVNVINGLDLSREQAERLRDLAREVERVSPSPPRFEPRESGPFAEVVRIYLDLREALLRGETPSASLRNKVIGARLLEAGLVRRTLVPDSNSRPQGACAQCHVRPEASATDATMAATGASAMFNEREQIRAHMELVVGRKTVAAMWWRMNRVDAVLKDYQKAAFEDFSCCLLPPDLSGSGLKIGQAADPSRMMEVLNEVRAAPAGDWPSVKDRLVSALSVRDRALHPRRSPDKEKEASDRLAAILERARAMSDVDFMIHKNALCAELEPARPRTTNPRLLRFKMAFFLLLPGSVRAYDAYLERLAERAATGSSLSP